MKKTNIIFVLKEIVFTNTCISLIDRGSPSDVTSQSYTPNPKLHMILSIRAGDTPYIRTSASSLIVAITVITSNIGVIIAEFLAALRDRSV